MINQSGLTANNANAAEWNRWGCVCHCVRGCVSGKDNSCDLDRSKQIAVSTMDSYEAHTVQIKSKRLHVLLFSSTEPKGI